jgi:hypothetical protein
MRKLIFFVVFAAGCTAFGQTLSPAADGHILRNQTFVFEQANPGHTYGGKVTYFNYFQNLYVGGEDTFTGDFIPGDGKATHYNRELRTVIEFDISSLSVTAGNFTASLKVTTDGNFWPSDPALVVKAYDQTPAAQNGVITQSDYAALTGSSLDQANMDAQPSAPPWIPMTYTFNVTSAVNDDVAASRGYSGFILIPDPRDGNEISLVSSHETPAQSRPQLVITSVQPDINVSVPGFCSTVTGTTRNIPVTVQNAGQADLVISGVSELSDPQNYFAEDLTGFNTTISAGGSSTFTVVFTPTSTGSFTARYRIASNDPDENPYDFNVSCTASSEQIPVLQVTMDPCTQVPVNATKTLNVTLANAGAAVLNITGVAETSDPFSVYALDLAGMAASVNPGASTQFKILFTPTTSGTFVGGVRISSNDPAQAVYDLALNCSSVSSQDPDIEVSPTSVTCSGMTPNQPAAQIITIRNVTQNANGDLILSALTMSGDAVYTLDTSWMKTTLKAGEQTTCTVNILAPSSGFYQGTLTIESNDPDTPAATVAFACAVTVSGVQTQTVAVPEPNAALLIPASALAAGAFNSYWVTDLRVHNPGATPATVRIHYLPTQTANTAAAAGDFVIPASTTLAIPNILKSLYGLSEGVGALLVVPTSPSGAHLLAVSRTYNLTSAGTYGQFIPGVAVSGFASIGQTLNLLGLGKGAHTRTNAGFVSGTGGAALSITLRKGDGTVLGTPYPVTLGANSHIQLGDIFAFTGASAQENVFAEVVLSSGTAFSYASVINYDDPIFIPMR